MRNVFFNPKGFLVFGALLSTTLNMSCNSMPVQPSITPSQAQSQPASPQSAVTRSDTFVNSDPGIRLFVREVRSTAESRNPILLLHGGGPGGIASFDIDVPGYSTAEAFAQAGHPVYLMDVRGWEQSTRLAGLDQPPNANPPLVTSEEAVRDISAVVDWIRQRHQNQSVALIGHASGGHWAGMYTSRNPQKVSHLVMLNSLYGVNALWDYRRTFERKDQPGQFDSSAAAYREITAEGLISNELG
jgi:pimeloyl-ACP methyl ester carboxylesterase